MNSALAAVIGLLLSIVLIIKKVSPVFSLMLGAVVGGLLAGWGLETTVAQMIGGVKDITPAIVRILAAGVLTGMLVKTGAASTIAHSIIKALGEKYIYLALALSAMILTGMGVFIDVAVITIAPIAIIMGNKLQLSKMKLLLAMIGGGKCGNIMSPNPNTIIAAENFDAPLSSVMAAGIVPALIGLAVTVFVIIPLIPKEKPTSLEGDKAKGDKARGDKVRGEEARGEEELPALWRSLLGPIVTIILLALRPIAGVVIDPMIALPIGGVVGIIATAKWRDTAACLTYGLEKMSGIAILLVGTGTLAGIIKASAIKDVLVGMLAGWSNGGTFMAPIAGALMSAATASTTAGATIASASFGEAILAAGVTAVWGAAMTNAGATTLDHLPHGSFFHATGGSMGFSVSERLRLIPYETLVGLILTLGSIGMYFVLG
ncbi:MAG: GntP family permease [Paludibacteraceae bacterium]|nr:GntP family permease [Paludibacteraceae bacterium]MBP3575631.1 GntP family permease [Paludibacteraceae bacterium]